MMYRWRGSIAGLCSRCTSVRAAAKRRHLEAKQAASTMEKPADKPLPLETRALLRGLEFDASKYWDYYYLCIIIMNYGK